MDYATLGLRREEAIFAHTTYAFRDKHLQQHHVSDAYHYKQ